MEKGSAIKCSKCGKYFEGLYDKCYMLIFNYGKFPEELADKLFASPLCGKCGAEFINNNPGVFFRFNSGSLFYNEDIDYISWFVESRSAGLYNVIETITYKNGLEESDSFLTSKYVIDLREAAGYVISWHKLLQEEQ